MARTHLPLDRRLFQARYLLRKSIGLGLQQGAKPVE